MTEKRGFGGGEFDGLHCVCGFIVVLTVLNRILKIYMIAPFAGLALSTLAAGGQTGTGGVFLY